MKTGQFYQFFESSNLKTLQELKDLKTRYLPLSVDGGVDTVRPAQEDS